MFSVYGASGRLFRGTLEQMRQIRPVHAADRTRVIEALNRDGRDSALREALESEPRTGEAQRSALAAYAPSRPPPGQRWGARRADAVMSREVVTLPDSATVYQAWQLLRRQGVGQAPVVNAGATLVGMVTLGALLSLDQLARSDGNYPAWRAALEHSVAAVMATPVPSVAPDAPLRRVASALLESGLPGLAVVDEDGRVTGFVSRSDILRAVLADAALDQWG